MNKQKKRNPWKVKCIDGVWCIERVANGTVNRIWCVSRIHAREQGERRNSRKWPEPIGLSSKNQEVVRFITRGSESYAEIGRMFGISRARVSQLARVAGVEKLR